jgi:nucleoside-diphosphate-sugar epimerase
VGRGCDVVGTTTRETRFADIESAGITPRLLDVADADQMGDLVRDRDIVYLTIAAGRGGPSYRDVYLRAARSLVRALPPSKVRRVIYTSSTAVYGQQRGEWVDESSPTNPESENGEVLVETENVLLHAASDSSAHAGLTVSILRLAGIYGPDREPSRFAARFAGQQRDDGDVFLNLVHRDDIVAALVRLSEKDHHGVLNLSDDAPTTRREVFDPLLHAANLPPVQWVAGDSTNRGKRISNRRIKQTLGLELRHPRFQGGAGES